MSLDGVGIGNEDTGIPPLVQYVPIGTDQWPAFTAVISYRLCNYLVYHHPVATPSHSDCTSKVYEAKSKVLCNTKEQPTPVEGTVKGNKHRETSFCVHDSDNMSFPLSRLCSCLVVWQAAPQWSWDVWNWRHKVQPLVWWPGTATQLHYYQWLVHILLLFCIFSHVSVW